MLQNEQTFPALEVPAVGGGSLNLPDDLSGSYGVILVYRGYWCPFCNEQLAAFQAASGALRDAGITTVAFSVDGENETRELMSKHGITFRMGHSADVDLVTQATGG